MPSIGETLAQHFGKVSGLRRPEPNSGEDSRQLSINVVYTTPERTITALRAVDSFARDLGATIHIRAMIAVPRQLALDLAFTSVQFLERLLINLVERIGSKYCEYVLHIYVCRNRIETLLRVLRPSSLVVIGGRRRLWRTSESRLLNAVVAAGHSVAFLHTTATSRRTR